MRKSDILNIIREELQAVLEAPANTDQNVQQEPLRPETQMDPRILKMKNDMLTLDKKLEQLNGKKAPIEKQIANINQAKARLQKKMDDVSQTVDRNKRTM